MFVDKYVGFEHELRTSSTVLASGLESVWMRLRAAFGRLVPLWPYLVCAACALYLFRRSLLEGHVFSESDTEFFYLPLLRWIDSALESGRVPLWSTSIFAGHPLFADGEHGMLYPPNLLSFLLLSPAQIFVFRRVVRFFLVGAFGYLFGRSLRLDRLPALTVGLAFTYGSFIVGQLHHTNLADTAIWLPLLLAGTEWALRGEGRRRRAALALSGLAVGMASLTVHANALLMMALLGALYAPARVLLCPDELNLPRALPARLRLAALAAALPVAFGLALGAVQLLPTWELAGFSRGLGLDLKYASQFSTPPPNFITLLFPYFFRDASAGYWSPLFKWQTTVYVGVAPLLLAGAALATRRGRLVWLWLAVIVVAALLMCGDFLPVNFYGLLWRVPPFNVVRNPARFMYWATLALAVLAGLGLQALFHPRAGDAARLRRYTALAAGLALGVILVLEAGSWLAAVYPLDVREWLTSRYLTLRGPSLERRAFDAFTGLRYSLDPGSPWTQRSLVFVAVTLTLLWLWQRGIGRARGLWQATLLAMLVVDLLGFADEYHPRRSLDEMFLPSRTGAFLSPRTGVNRVLTLWPANDVWPNKLLPLRVPEAGGYSSLRTNRHNTFVGLASEGEPVFMDLLNVKYVVVRYMSVPGWLAYESPVHTDESLDVYARPARLSKTFLVSEARVGSADEVLKGLQGFRFDPARLTWLEGDVLPLVSGQSGPAGTAELLSYAPEALTIRARAEREAYLVVTDSYYPGWRAWLDGRPVPIYRADYLFRAVWLPPGEHTVEMRFEPLSVRWGAALSLTALVGLALLVLLPLRKRTGEAAK